MKGYFKCRNCRHLLELDSDSICTNHGISLDHLRNAETIEQTDGTVCEDNHYFFIESKLNQIQWISDQIDKAEWTKGKINCPNQCGSKIGTFNFVNPLKCSCGTNITPSAHLIKSRVDFHEIESQNSI